MKPLDGYAAYIDAWQAGLLPDPPLWIDEWSVDHMVIPAETGAAESGPYRLDRTPYAREPMRSLSPESPARVVVVRGASQMLKTQVGLNAVCAWIANVPANIIVLEPSEFLARRLASRFDKTAAAVAVVRALVAPPKSRDKTNRTDTKEFRGGTLWIMTGRSASNLREASARYLWVDEVTALLKEIKGEGDPIALAKKRLATFGRNAKEYYTSSAGDEGSKITELFEKGDQRWPLAKCPHCGGYQVLEWERLVYDLAEGWAKYPCEHCAALIEEHHKPEMFAEGRWEATAEGDGETHSYSISYLYAPLGWDPWIKLAREYEEAKADFAKGDPEKMQAFMNTRLALDWSPKTSHLKAEDIKARAEDFPLGIAQMPVLVLTAACDVQHQRLEITITGWGFGPCGLEAWITGVHIIHGDTTLDKTWQKFDELLKTPVRHQSGAAMVIRAALVDASDGNRSDEVYAFCAARKRRWVHGQEQAVLAVKGASKPGKPVIAGKPGLVDINRRGRFVPRGAESWPVGTDTAKDWIFNRLELKNRNAIHFPAELPLDYYKQLLSETRRIVRKRGQKVTVYDHKKGEPNEMLDTLVYCYAGACWLGLHRWTAEHWQRERDKFRQVFLPLEDEMGIHMLPKHIVADPQPIPTPPIIVPITPAPPRSAPRPTFFIPD